MAEASKLSISLDFGDKREKTPIGHLLTLNRVIKWIKAQELDEYTTAGLIKIAQGYPNQALPMFLKNFQVMLGRVRAQRKKEGFEDAPTQNANENKPEEKFVSNLDEGLGFKWEAQAVPQESSVEEIVEESLEEDFDEGFGNVVVESDDPDQD